MPADRSATRRTAPTDDIFSPDEDNFAREERRTLFENLAPWVAKAMLSRAILASPLCHAWCSVHVVVTANVSWTTALRAPVRMGPGRDDGLLWRGEHDERTAPAMLECEPGLAACIRFRLSGTHEQASDLVRCRRAAVSALADALVELRTLSSEEARDVVQRRTGQECLA